MYAGLLIMNVTLWLKYFSNLIRPNCTQEVQSRGDDPNIFTTFTTPSGICCSFNACVVDLNWRIIYCRVSSNVPGVASVDFESPKTLCTWMVFGRIVPRTEESRNRCYMHTRPHHTHTHTHTPHTLSLAHWMVCSMVAGNDLRVQ